MKCSRDWLKSLRIEKSFTMKQVATKAGISESQYCLIEAGFRRPSVDTAQSIAKFLGFNWEVFFPVRETMS